MVRGGNPQTRCRILAVALELFASKGYDRTSLREISQRLGFSKAALYYHFKAKQDILEALAGDLIDKLEQIVRSALADPDRSAATRTRFLGDLVDLVLSNRATADLLLSVQPPLDHTNLGERVNRLLPLAGEALLPPEPSVEDRIRASAAISVVSSVIGHLADVPADTLRAVVVDLAVSTLVRDHSPETVASG